MKKNLKPLLVSAGVVAALVVGAGAWWAIAREAQPEGGSSAAVVRPSSHALDDGGEDAVTIVEFLDFECEACGAAYPYVEELREQYAGRVTYVVRYFPLPGHLNSTNAALAAEAAARQGRFEEMYHALFQSQAQWGEASESRAAFFRELADGIGLDLAVYDRDVADPATAARVEEDFADGRALGVTGTPTFFVAEQRLIDLTSWTDVTDAIDAELAR